MAAPSMSADLQALLVLSMILAESSDEEQILRLATSAVPSFTSCWAVGVYSDGSWYEASDLRPGEWKRLERRVKALDAVGGALEVPGAVWGAAYPLRSLTEPRGWFVLAADQRPSDKDRFLAQALSRQTGLAVADARQHVRYEQTQRRLRELNARLEETVAKLRRGMEIHTRLTEVVASGEGLEGLARAVHDLVGLPVAIEDRHGNLRAQAGHEDPDAAQAHCRTTRERERITQTALEQRSPVREDDRWFAIARAQNNVLGLLRVEDPDAEAGDQELLALEHAATVLGLELAHLQSLVETELRLQRDLVEDLLSGAEEDSLLARARALNYDLEQDHRVVLATADEDLDPDRVFHAVRVAAHDAEAGSLLAAHSDHVVLLANSVVDWEEFAAAVEERVGECRVAVSGCCGAISELPTGYDQARFALRLQRSLPGPERSIRFDDLGVFRILHQIGDPGPIRALAREWLEPLLAYDRENDYQLVETLTQYFEHGGNYEETAEALYIHRSTLKYRLNRIREISGYDLTDPDTRFNLHLATRAWTTLETFGAD